MSRRDTLFGLPRYVLAILRHMEAHSERLKWSLAEESNQLTLTLTWNFDSNKPRKTKETLWKKLQRSLGLERHSSSPLSHSSQPDLQQTPITRRFLLETSSPLTDEHAVSSSRSTFDGWRSRDSQLTVTSRCRSLPGRMHDSGGQSVDNWERSSMSYRQTRARRSAESASVPLRPRRSHHHHHQQQQQQQQALYTRHTSSPTYVTPSSHLTLPVHRSRGTVMAAKSVGRSGVHSQRRVSMSHFSWPGASFELQTGLGDDEECRSSGGTQGAAEPTSPSLPSSTSTATNACTRPLPRDVTATNDDVTPSNGDADTEIADVTAAVCADNGDVITSDDVKSEQVHAESGLRRRRRSCEFNMLDDDDSWTDRRDDDVIDEWSDWADVICVSDDNQVTTAATTTLNTTTTTTASTSVTAADDDDDDARDDVTQTAINETVMKCIESCDKVLLRHSTAIR